MDRERAWERVQAALDERRDPFDDELLQEWFAEHPRELEEYGALERRLRRLQRAETGTSQRGRSAPGPKQRVRQLVGAAVAAAVLALAAIQSGARGPQLERRAGSPSRLIGYQLTLTRATGSSVQRTTHDLRGDALTTSSTNTSGEGVTAHSRAKIHHTSIQDGSPR